MSGFMSSHGNVAGAGVRSMSGSVRTMAGTVGHREYGVREDGRGSEGGSMEGERIKNGARPCDEDLGIAAVEPIERPPVPVDVRMDCGLAD